MTSAPLPTLRGATTARTSGTKPSSNRRWVRRWQVAALTPTISASSALLSRPLFCSNRNILRSMRSRRPAMEESSLDGAVLARKRTIFARRRGHSMQKAAALESTFPGVHDRRLLKRSTINGHAMLSKFARYPLTFGPTHIEKLARLSRHLGDKVELYAKREDCNSGLAFGGNKLRKLEYIIPDAI